MQQNVFFKQIPNERVHWHGDILMNHMILILCFSYFTKSELANITGKSPKAFQSSEDYLQQKFQDESGSNEENSNGLLLVSLLFYLC